jgi:hypothetical protein
MTVLEKLLAMKNVSLAAQVESKLPLAGGVMSGDVNFDSNKITMVEDITFTDGHHVGQAMHILVYNDTGVDFPKGTPLSVTFGNTGTVPNAKIASSANLIDYYGFTGLAGALIVAGTSGLVLREGILSGIDTSLLAETFLYLGVDGTFVQTRPKFPQYRQIIGAVTLSAVDGIIAIGPQKVNRHTMRPSYSFTSNGLTAGVYYKGGFYDWAETHANLDDASPTQTYGIIGHSYAAHASIVAAGAGTVDTGQVGLRVTGIEDTEGGQVAGQTGIITDDITTLTSNVYYETIEKFSGEMTFELYVVSGTPTAYSLDFNYGYSKYEDLNDSNFTVVGFESLWRASWDDPAFNIELLLHHPEGWAHAATGFIPGNSSICEKAVDQALAGNTINGLDGSYKRTDLNEYIHGSVDHGVLIRVTTGNKSTIQTMDMHIHCEMEDI